ncbi:MAG TPA: amidohydrolase family protein [Bryobacteraceae bacterium]|nr:amidohydrolase family protein [Bryobacteraceae bacterium]
MRPYIAQIKSNLRLMARDRAVLFFSYLFPLIFFFVFAQSSHGSESAGAMTQIITMVLIISILGSGFFGAGMRAVQDRETNVLRRFKVAPVGAAPIIVASMVSGLVSFLPVVVLFFVLANVRYHMPIPHNILTVLFFVAIALIAFRALGMIVASVVNSAAEANILIQILYLPMLFLSGATFPISMMPTWVQSIAQFLPATYLYQGLQSLMIGGEGLLANPLPLLALIVTTAVALIVGVKLFRWEKEEKIAGTAKLWVLATLAPFLLMGLYQARTRQNIEKAKILARDVSRHSSVLLQNAKIIVGNGTVVERGAVLVRNGKIVQVFGTPPSKTDGLRAEVVDASGKTLMPGLIDMHVHIGAPGGIYSDSAKYADPHAPEQRDAAYLASGITAVRSVGDWLHGALELRGEINSGKYLGAEFFTDGPLFTAPGGHPEELIQNIPENMRAYARSEFLRQPKSAAEARHQVDALKQAGVTGIKAVLDAGSPNWHVFHRLDTGIYRAIIAEAAKDGLPSATHTGSSGDVQDAVTAGTNSIEHGSLVDLIPNNLFAEMKAKGIAYDPTLSVVEALRDAASGNASLLNRSLLQQVAPADLLDTTRKYLKTKHGDPQFLNQALANCTQNLLHAYQQGVLLIAGSDAGNMLVIHGPTVQHELELWVKAGIPTSVALQAATFNAARTLRASDRIGLIQPGRDATLILLDGDPIADIAVTEHINAVYFKGEHIDRTDVLKQDLE